MSFYLFIFLSHQHVQHMTSQILLILIDFDSFFWLTFSSETSLVETVITRKDIKKTVIALELEEIL